MDRHRTWLWGLPVLALCAAPGATATGQTSADNLDAALLRQAPAIISYLRTNNYKNVGVLKFLVQKGNDHPSDNVGPLNGSIATRLEIALILCNKSKDDQQVGIIRNASSVASHIEGANHLTPLGRQRLFTGQFPLAWGKSMVNADAFVTGKLKLMPDLRTMTIQFAVLGRNDHVLRELDQDLVVTTDPVTLIEAGESYTLRGAFDGGKVVAQQCAEQAIKAKTQLDQFPLKAVNAPIGLRIVYDDKEVQFNWKNGKALIREPRPGQKMAFVLERKVTTQERFGVVLMVNGENTLYRERRQPIQCSRWILTAESPRLIIEGYKTGKDTGEEFRVLSRRESKASEMNYGADVGTIALIVLRERQEKAAPPSLSEEAEDVAAIGKSELPQEPALNLAVLKRQLRTEAQVSRQRGLIVPGKEIDMKTREVDFLADPVPVQSVILTYYRPEG